MIIDLAVLLILIFSVIVGYKKGFTKIFVKFMALILAIVLGFLLQEPISDYLYDYTSVGPNIEKNISTFVEKNVDLDNTKDSVVGLIIKQEDIEQGIDKVNYNITMIVLKGISFIIVVLVVYIICFILEMVLNVAFNLPVLGTINKLAGVGISLIATVTKLWVLFAILLFITPLIGENVVTEIVNNSQLTKFLYENNLLVNLIKFNFKI